MSFGSYTTHKQVVIRSWRLGALYHALVGCVVAYVVCYLVYAERGYQMRSTVNGNIGVKVKGQAVMRDVATGRATVYDANDVVTYEPSGFFVATAVATTLQARGTCAGEDEEEVCTEDENVCVEGMVSASGVMTGKCLRAGNDSEGRETKRCEISGWCPGEPEEDKVQILENVGNFTVFLRISVEFPGIKNPEGDGNALWTNLNGTEPTHGWNLFTVEDLLASGGKSVKEIATKGWDARVDIPFDCNLDRGMDSCAPETPYVTRQVVNTKQNTLSKGYNIRWISGHNVGEPASLPGVTYDQVQGSKDVRLLVKGYGPRIRFEVTGVGRKFDLLTLSTTVGAGLAFLGIATVIVNAVMLYGSGTKSKQYEDWLFAEFKDDSYGSTGTRNREIVLYDSKMKCSTCKKERRLCITNPS